MKKVIFILLLISSLFFIGCGEELSEKYIVTWKNYDGTILEIDGDVEYGVLPTYDKEVPTKPDDTENTYTFTGWSPEVDIVTRDITYTAQYTNIFDNYTVTWKNYDETILEIDSNVKYGTIPTYDKEVPTRSKDTYYTYEFTGWSPEVDIVTKDIIYTAQFKQEISLKEDEYVYSIENNLITINKINNKLIEELIIPEYIEGLLVSKIGDSAFSDCKKLKNITIPKSVNTIADYAFNDCSSLISINIPESVTYIGSTAFNGCTMLSSITVDKNNKVYDSRDNCNAIIETKENKLIRGSISTIIPNSIISIGDYAFFNCNTLNELTLSDNIVNIGDFAFSGCYYLTNILIPKNVKNIGKSVFDYCGKLNSIIVDENNLVYDSRDNCNAIIETKENKLIRGCNSTIIPESITSIGDNAFTGYNKLESIIIPKNVISIGDCAFKDCNKLTEIVIPENVNSIGSSAFSNCYYLTHITIPESVTSIKDYTFNLCSKLMNITIPKNVTSIGAFAFYGCYSLSSVIIPEKVINIDDSAFSACTNLSFISLPIKLESIGSLAFNDCSNLNNIIIPENVSSIGDNAFKGCDSLVTISVDKNNKVYDSRDNCNAIIKTKENKLIKGCRATIIPESVTSIGDYAFNHCLIIVKINIPKNVTDIGDYAFSDCMDMNSIILPDSIISIGDNAFNGCYKLMSIMIPKNVTSIGNNAFKGCSNINTISVDENNMFYDSRNNCNAIIETKENKLIKGCISTIIPESITSIGDYAFDDCKNLEKIILPESIIAIGDYAFNNCIGLTNITIPNKITIIGNYVFSGCYGLTNVIIPESVISIGDSAFSKCYNLTEIVLPKNIVKIGNNAFSNCYGLTNITIPKSVISIGFSIFSKCSELRNITVEKNNPVYDSRDNCNAIIITKENKLIYGCSSTTIPESVISIRDYAFNGYNNLLSIIIPESVTSIGDYAFTGCNGLTINCEASSQPTGWSNLWNYSKRPVNWGYEK